MNEPLEISAGMIIPADELHWRFSRSSGPGGQGVNTTDSRVELVWDAERSAVLSGAVRDRALQRLAGRLIDGEIVVVASEYRSQLRNRAAARARMASLIREAIAPPRPQRRATRPSAGSRRRRLESKRRRSEVKRLRRDTDG